MNLKRNTLLVVPLVGIILTGCAGTPKSEYTAFAQAGSQYAAAIDKTLIAAGVAQVDATSWALVKAKGKHPNRVVTDRDYTGRTDVDKERLKIISDLRAHAKLLGRYFGHLESLATSDEPEKTKTAIEGVVAGIDKLKADGNLPAVTSALPAFGKLGVDLKIRAALKEELDARKDVIREELELQEKLLQTLTGQISHALESTNEKQEKLLVKDRIMNPQKLEGRDAEKWVSTRRDIIYLPTMIEEISSASDAARTMRESFEALLSGEDAMGRINALIVEIESILAVVDTINS
uniref:Uncharacterized protein n=1 Tax=Candidatus Kentrum sp. LFY TaxID=2126342 RepID=A0A450V4P1_9GAMM|nr:MAG: hypothetical protein BECKLFY1418A_GA0070994_11031 [Candidatus Kentron sp. LFY]